MMVHPVKVKFEELQEIFIIKGGFTPSTKNKSYWDNGTISWFRLDDIRRGGRILNESLRKITTSALKGKRPFPKNSIIITTSATIGEHALITIPHQASNRFTSLSPKSQFESKLNMRFTFYYCFILGDWCRSNTNQATFSAVNMNRFKKFSFPIPPLSVQLKIVKVLDMFMELEAELEAELEERMRQYRYYLDSLLSFPGSNESGSEHDRVVWRTLGDVGTFIRGRAFQKSDFTSSGAECIHYGEVHTHYGTWTKTTKSFIESSLASRLRRATTGNLIIATTSEDEESVAKAVAWLGKGEVAVGGHACIFQHNLNPKYVSYFFQTSHFDLQKRPHIIGAKVKDILVGKLEKIRIPIPSREEQERVVAILDSFNALVSSLSIGIPAEIGARRQQYEYYRNQLLSFQEAS